MHLSSIIHLKPYEKIEYVLRRHPITFVPKLFSFIILILIPIIVSIIGKSIIEAVSANPSAYATIIVLGVMYYLTIFLLFYSFYIDYYLDIWVVTNDRVLDMEQQGMFSRTITEFDLYQIQDITTDIKGVFATLFRYGNITITTSSSTTGIIFYQIPGPDAIRSHILTLAEQDRKYHEQKSEKPS